jgi:hypothetical protein
MSRSCRLGSALALLVLGGPVLAEEVVFFKSGAALPIVSHKVDGNMIHVDLGDNAFMAFPISVVDRVEQAGKNVMIGRSGVGGTNVMRARPDPTGSFPVTGSAPAMRSENARFGDEEPVDDPAIDVVDGVAVYRPFAASGNPAKADTGVTGHARVRQSSGKGALRGARMVGTKQVIGPVGPRSRGGGNAPILAGVELSPAPPPPPPPTDGSDGAESGDEE